MICWLIHSLTDPDLSCTGTFGFESLFILILSLGLSFLSIDASCDGCRA